MKVYKLTDANGTTYNETQWKPGARHKVTGRLKMCDNGIHAYSDPLLALLLNPMHANIMTPWLWECEASDEHLDDHGLKSCHRWLQTIRELPVPQITTEQRMRFAILCAIESGCNDSTWVAWALHWLDGSDHSEAAATSAASAAWAAAMEAAGAAAAAAAAAAVGCGGRQRAAVTAAFAASAATRTAKDINLVAIAHEACEKE